jgi:Co/Zn/Cd efflux system component
MDTMKRLNYRIAGGAGDMFDAVTVATTPIAERQWSPGKNGQRPRPQGFQPLSTSEEGSPPKGNNNNSSSLEMNGRIWRRQRLSSRDYLPPPEESIELPDDDESFDDEEEFSTNERLLIIAFISFMSFSVTQMYFSVRVAKSEAMQGDSAAMMVDSLTYLFNWMAERRKHTFDDTYETPVDIVDPAKARRIRQRARRKVMLQLEILPPLISVATLLVVTGVVLRKAADVILLDLRRSTDEQATPNVNLMLAFSLINLGLDGLNFFCFAKSSHLFGYDTTDRVPVDSLGAAEPEDHFSRPSIHADHGRVRKKASRDEDDEQEEDDSDDDDSDEHPHANLNMVSYCDCPRMGCLLLSNPISLIFFILSVRPIPTCLRTPSEV